MNDRPEHNSRIDAVILKEAFRCPVARTLALSKYRRYLAMILDDRQKRLHLGHRQLSRSSSGTSAELMQERLARDSLADATMQQFRWFASVSKSHQKLQAYRKSTISDNDSKVERRQTDQQSFQVDGAMSLQFRCRGSSAASCRLDWPCTLRTSRDLRRDYCPPDDDLSVVSTADILYDNRAVHMPFERLLIYADFCSSRPHFRTLLADNKRDYKFVSGNTAFWGPKYHIPNQAITEACHTDDRNLIESHSDCRSVVQSTQMPRGAQEDKGTAQDSKTLDSTGRSSIISKRYHEQKSNIVKQAHRRSSSAKSHSLTSSPFSQPAESRSQRPVQIDSTPSSSFAPSPAPSHGLQHPPSRHH